MDKFSKIEKAAPVFLTNTIEKKLGITFITWYNSNELFIMIFIIWSTIKTIQVIL